MSITVYSKPRCPQCDATYRALDKQGISYEKIDVTQDAESLAFIKGLGYQQAPVVVVGEDHWSGLRPDRIKAIAAAALAMSACGASTSPGHSAGAFTCPGRDEAEATPRKRTDTGRVVRNATSRVTRENA